MLHRIQQKLGTAGFIISIIALVAALCGGAYAASGGLTGKQKKEVEKIAKKVGGKPGPQGPAGSAGAAGAVGTKGDAGAAGVNGSDGSDGKSVSVTPIAEGGAECEERGGAMVKQEGASSGVEVCNGAAAEGGEGEYPETLPSEAVETGTFAFQAIHVEPPDQIESSPVSFSIPLSPEDAENTTIEVWEGTPTPNCAGTPNAPTAEPGTLCFYVSEVHGQITHLVPGDVYQPAFANPGIGTSGALIVYENTQLGSYVVGSYAVAAR